ncbi:hypothetical protein [Victivallis vadensis]|uniref:hypothetical protein n=1 Tax=Victivallis vadensis TaxID=172901 RepID=UPI003AF57230
MNRKKICPRCGLRPRAAGRGWCKECQREYSTERNRSNPERYREIQHQAYLRRLSAANRRERFQKLLEWCRAEGISELARRVR